MKTKSTLIIIAVLSLTAFNIYSQSNDLTWNIIYRLSNPSVINVGDVSKHSIGVAEGTGLGFLNDGAVGVMNGAFNYDYVDGNGNFMAYYTVTFDDGSSFTAKTDGKAELLQNPDRTVFSGTITYVNGKGKYEGISGTGTVSGKRLEGLQSGTPVYLAIVSTYDLKK